MSKAKNKPISPNHKIFRFKEKSQHNTPNSISTLEESVSKLSKIDFHTGSSLSVYSRTKQSPLTFLRSELNSIKSQMTRLIEKGPVDFQERFQQNEQENTDQNHKDLIKRKESLVECQDRAERQHQNIKEELKAQDDKNEQEINKLKLELENFKADMKQALSREWETKQQNAHFLEQIGSLKKIKQQLQKEIKAKNTEIRRAHQQIETLEKSYTAYKNEADVSSRRNEKKDAKIKELGEDLNKIKIEMESWKDENKELIKIINQKEKEAEQINCSFELKIEQLETQVSQLLQYKKSSPKVEQKAIQTLEKVCKQICAQTQQKQDRAVVIRLSSQQSKESLNKMEREVHFLRGQIRNKEKTMQCMLSDIRFMEKELKNVDILQRSNHEHYKLINELSNQIMRDKAQLLSQKYRTR